MSDSHESLRAEFEEIFPTLERVVEDLKEWLREACQGLGIYAPRIEGRVKEPHSLVLKAIRRQWEGRPYADPLREISDKAGARADLVYAADVDRLVARVCRASDVFGSVGDEDVDDKRLKLRADQVGYAGVHIDVVPLQRYGLPEEFARCEIQVRTNAQAAWAMASHQLVYKPPVQRTIAEKRRVNRLTALLELFDEQVTIAQDAMKRDGGYPIAIVLEALQAARFRFVGTDYDRTLTAELVQALVPAHDADSAESLVREVTRFADDHADRLRDVLKRTRPALLAQPDPHLHASRG